MWNWIFLTKFDICYSYSDVSGKSTEQSVRNNGGFWRIRMYPFWMYIPYRCSWNVRRSPNNRSRWLVQWIRQWTYPIGFCKVYFTSYINHQNSVNYTLHFYPFRLYYDTHFASNSCESCITIQISIRLKTKNVLRYNPQQTYDGCGQEISRFRPSSPQAYRTPCSSHRQQPKGTPLPPPQVRMNVYYLIGQYGG